MQDLQEQLAELRKRIARIDRKYQDGGAAAGPLAAAAAASTRVVDLPGQEVETPEGRHWETETLYESHRQHGSADIGALCELPHDLLAAISGGEVAAAAPGEWAFLDTETTGIAGGSGTYAFLVGVGHITPHGFRVRQFFMRDYAEEPSQLAAVAKYLEPFKVLITYNGRTFDQPLLETRYRMTRLRPPFTRLQHLDLLFGARRLWKLRFESCRLVELENRILGVERHGDVPGSMIPYIYFDYLHKKETLRLLPVFHHNVLDIVTLACLTGIVPWAFQSPETAPLKHGTEMAGLARWLLQADQTGSALALFRRAIDAGLPDDVLFRTMWDVAMIEKRAGRHEAAVASLADLAASPNAFRAKACEELAKHYEHRERSLEMAIEMTNRARAIEDSERLRRRSERLAKKRHSGARRLLADAGGD